MLRTADHLASHFVPVNAVVQLLIDESDYCDIVAANKVKTMADLGAGLVVRTASNYSLDCFIKDDIRDLIAGKEGANEGTAVDGDNEDLFCLESQCRACRNNASTYY